MAIGPATGSPVLQPLGPRTRGPGGLVALVVIGLIVAVLKPWSGLESARSGAGSAGGGGAGGIANAAGGATPTATPTPSPSPTPPDLAAIARTAVNAECNQPSGWRLYDIDRWRGKPIHVWLAIDAVRASGPLDPAIEVLPVVASAVDALGFCAPVVGTVPSPSADGSVSIWRVTTPFGAAAPVAVVVPEVRLSPVLPTGVETTLGGLYAGPPAPVEGSGGWTDGTYIFSVDGWWFGAIVHLMPDADFPSETPTPRP